MIASAPGPVLASDYGGPTTNAGSGGHAGKRLQQADYSTVFGLHHHHHFRTIPPRLAAFTDWDQVVADQDQRPASGVRNPSASVDPRNRRTLTSFFANVGC